MHITHVALLGGVLVQTVLRPTWDHHKVLRFKRLKESPFSFLFCYRHSEQSGVWRLVTAACVQSQDVMQQLHRPGLMSQVHLQSACKTEPSTGARSPALANSPKA